MLSNLEKKTHQSNIDVLEEKSTNSENIEATWDNLYGWNLQVMFRKMKNISKRV